MNVFPRIFSIWDSLFQPIRYFLGSSAKCLLEIFILCLFHVIREKKRITFYYLAHTKVYTQQGKSSHIDYDSMMVPQEITGYMQNIFHFDNRISVHRGSASSIE